MIKYRQLIQPVVHLYLILIRIITLSLRVEVLWRSRIVADNRYLYQFHSLQNGFFFNKYKTTINDKIRNIKLIEFKIPSKSISVSNYQRNQAISLVGDMALQSAFVEDLETISCFFQSFYALLFSVVYVPLWILDSVPSFISFWRRFYYITLAVLPSVFGYLSFYFST